MSLCIGIILLVLSSGVGVSIANGYKRRSKFLNDFDSFLQIMLSNCSFLQEPLKRVLETNKGRFGRDFDAFLADFYKNLDTKEEFLFDWRKTQRIVSVDEASFVEGILSSVGRLDCFSQIDEIKNAKETLKEKLKNACEIVKTKGIMSTKLGIIVGTGLFIICI